MTNTYANMIEALTIFAKYFPDDEAITASEHDEISSGGDKEGMLDTDLARLTELGWSYDERYTCFTRFV